MQPSSSLRQMFQASQPILAMMETWQLQEMSMWCRRTLWMDWKNAGFPGFVQDVKNLGEFDDVFTR